jgi:hypothetical protein
LRWNIWVGERREKEVSSVIDKIDATFGLVKGGKKKLVVL